MDEDRNRTCWGCEFFKLTFEGNDSSLGNCQRHPPRFNREQYDAVLCDIGPKHDIAFRYAWVFPMVDASGDWCGDFRWATDAEIKRRDDEADEYEKRRAEYRQKKRA